MHVNHILDQLSLFYTVYFTLHILLNMEDEIRLVFFLVCQPVTCQTLPQNSFPHLPGLSRGCCLHIFKTCCIAVGTESILALYSYKKVRNLNLPVSGTEQKRPCVPVTCPKEGSGQTRSCLQVRAIYGHIVWVSFVSTPFPVQHTDTQIHHPSTRRAAAAPAWPLSCARASGGASALAWSVLQVWFGWREGGFKSVSLQ